MCFLFTASNMLSYQSIPFRNTDSGENVQGHSEAGSTSGQILIPFPVPVESEP